MYNREWGERVWGKSNLPQKSPKVFLNKSLDPPNQKFLDPSLHTHQLEFANTSLPTLVCRVKAA